MPAERELPSYRCHKVVWALKIAEIAPGPDGGALITPADGLYAPFPVNAAYVRRCDPQVGEYYVRHQDGRECIWPAVEFETGYTLIKD